MNCCICSFAYSFLCGLRFLNVAAKLKQKVPSASYFGLFSGKHSGILCNFSSMRSIVFLMHLHFPGITFVSFSCPGTHFGYCLAFSYCLLLPLLHVDHHHLLQIPDLMQPHNTSKEYICCKIINM